VSKPLVEIKYSRIKVSGWVHWELIYDAPNGKRLFVAQENGTENNKRLAKKAAEHAQRLTQAALEKGK
jgi:hypothetical protein